MDCGIPFCHSGCPLGNLIPDWNDLVYRDRWPDAIDALHATNNFPEFTGRICPAPCEAAVRARHQRRRRHDQADRAVDHRPRLGGGLGQARAARRAARGKTVAVVGSGPAGLAAAAGAEPASATRSRCSSATTASAACCASACRTSSSRSGSCSAASTRSSRGGRRDAHRRERRRATSRATSCASSSTRSCSRSARRSRATCPCPAASSTACTSRWSTSSMRNRCVARRVPRRHADHAPPASTS